MTKLSKQHEQAMANMTNEWQRRSELGASWETLDYLFIGRLIDCKIVDGDYCYRHRFFKAANK